MPDFARSPRPRRRRLGLSRRRWIQAASLVVFLALFFYVAWPYEQTFSPTALSDKEIVPAETFLWLDPLVGLSAAIAARALTMALLGLVAVAVVGLVLPRGFCGYLCPLGTLLDLFDGSVGRVLRRGGSARRKNPASSRRAGAPSPWALLRFGVLLAVLAAAAGGLMLTGFVAAIPLLTRLLEFSVGRLQLGLMRNWGQLTPATPAIYLSVALATGVFLMGLFGRRLWCRTVCPSGALLSLLGLGRLRQRTVEMSCISCGRCREACSFDAVEADFTTRAWACASCPDCRDVCPVGAIQFRWRFGRRAERALKPPATASGLGLTRRGLLCGAGGAALVAAAARVRAGGAGTRKLLRPPGSAEEGEFSALCVRCGECFRVCPGGVLHPAGLDGGLDALWTPVVVPSRGGCHPECNFCTQVCPTGAIRPLTLAQKRRARIGRARIDRSICLAHTGREACRLCYQECVSAGYNAIRLRTIRLEVGEVPEGALSPEELEAMSQIEAPFVVSGQCVGCGMCEYRCHAALVKQRGQLSRSAIVVEPQAM